MEELPSQFSWTRQMGYPVVVANYDKASKTLKLTQRRFFADGTEGCISQLLSCRVELYYWIHYDCADETNPMWRIPINVCTASKPMEPLAKLLMTEREQTFKLDGVHDGDWIKLNAGMKGFYRVQYSQVRSRSHSSMHSQRVFSNAGNVGRATAGCE